MDTLNGLLGDKEALRKVLLRHVIPGRLATMMTTTMTTMMSDDYNDANNDDHDDEHNDHDE